MVRWTFAFVLLLVFGLGLGFQPQTVAEDKVKTKGQLTFEVYKDKEGEFRWRLKAANGQIIATGGQGYKAKADCEHGIDLIKEGAAKAKIKDTTAK